MKTILKALVFGIGFGFGTLYAAAPASDYLVMISEESFAEIEWSTVAEALAEKHDGAPVVTYAEGDFEGILAALQEARPRHACFVCPHAEVTRAFVSGVHQASRKIDDDPYADVRWGILTGWDAANALAIAQTDDPLEVGKVASGTEVALEQCREGIWYCELQQGRMVRKVEGGEPLQAQGPDDTTSALVETLNTYEADLFITSGHATERDWQIGYSYRNGPFRSEEGVIFGLDLEKEKFIVDSPNPKVYMPIGNCLMGHIDGQDAMALAWMKSAGVRQMLGYTIETWYGYAGWGCLDYFVEQPGRYTFSEAFFANQHALIHRLETFFPGLASKPLADPSEAQRLRSVNAAPAAAEAGLKGQDAVGLLFDRDAVVFYGDPAWEARMAEGERAYEQSFEEGEDGVFTLEITPNWEEKSFDPVNTNGAQRGGRPIVAFIDRPEGEVEIIEGAGLDPVIADDFILVPNPGECDPDKVYRVSFRVAGSE